MPFIEDKKKQKSCLYLLDFFHRYKCFLIEAQK